MGNEIRRHDAGREAAEKAREVQKQQQEKQKQRVEKQAKQVEEVRTKAVERQEKVKEAEQAKPIFGKENVTTEKKEYSPKEIDSIFNDVLKGGVEDSEIDRLTDQFTKNPSENHFENVHDYFKGILDGGLSKKERKELHELLKDGKITEAEYKEKLEEAGVAPEAAAPEAAPAEAAPAAAEAGAAPAAGGPAAPANNIAAMAKADAEGDFMRQQTMGMGAMGNMGNMNPMNNAVNPMILATSIQNDGMNGPMQGLGILSTDSIFGGMNNQSGALGGLAFGNQNPQFGFDPYGPDQKTPEYITAYNKAYSEIAGKGGKQEDSGFLGGLFGGGSGGGIGGAIAGVGKKVLGGLTGGLF